MGNDLLGSERVHRRVSSHAAKEIEAALQKRYRLRVIPTHIQDLATAAVASVQATLKFELDYTQSTLPILQHYVETQLADVRDEARALMLTAAGAYFGEVVRRRLEAARWFAPADQPEKWRLEVEPVFLCFNPVGVALEIAEQSDAPGWGAHLHVLPADQEAVLEALAQYGDVRDEDYYSFSVRFETIEQITEHLIRGIDPEHRRVFMSEDYQAFVDAEERDAT